MTPRQTRISALIAGLVLVLVACSLSLWGAPPVPRNPSPTTFDPIFRRAVGVWWPPGQRREWRWLKAQGIVESGLRPDAISPAGAMGVLQLMPPTWGDLQRGHRVAGGPLQARANIVQGARYMAWLGERFASAPGRACQRDLQFAAYHTGVGRIRAAQRLAAGARCWPGIAPRVPEVPGGGPATAQYVRRIHLVREQMP